MVYSFTWGGELDSSDLLLSYPLISLASPVTNILKSTHKHINTCSFKKFVEYTKIHAKAVVANNFFARMRVQADVYFRPPIDEAKEIIIDFYRHIAVIDIRKNYRAQLEKPPLFCCSVCHTRYTSIKSFEKHQRKGDNAVEHKRQHQMAEVFESQKYVNSLKMAISLFCCCYVPLLLVH